MRKGENRQVLNELKKSIHKPDNYPISVVRIISNQIYKSKLIISSLNERSEFVHLRVPVESRAQFEKIISGSEILSIYFDRIQCMAQVKCLSYDDERGLLTTSKPFKIIFNERREEKRLILKHKMNLLYNNENKNLLKKIVYDLSLGGFSIVFSNIEMVRIKIGEKLLKVYFEYQGKVEYIDCSVVSRLKLKPFELESLPYAGTRVSCKFEKIDIQQELFIKAILNLESDNLKVG